MVFIGLFIILACVLFMPFLIKKVEEQLEIFLFTMGVISVTITAQWTIGLVVEALVEPIKITVTVLVAGILFYFLQKPIRKAVKTLYVRIGAGLFSFLVIVFLGLFSSIITAIIASLVLVEIISALELDKENEIKLVVLSCFSIGMGAALTPVGEPLATLVIAKLKGEPFHADFWFLLQNLGLLIIPGVIVIGIFSFFFIKPNPEHVKGLEEEKAESIKDMILRTVKVYIFIMALIFLGTGFKPIIEKFISKIPSLGLYWINMISAILDNATLVAAEISPKMELPQIKDAILGLIIAGGMLIPGNIPNIISANKLKIKSLEWAKYGVPVGLVIMLIYFVIIFFVR
jgi:predicted cation transporter